MNHPFYEIHELIKDQDPITGEICSGDEVYLGKRKTENSAIRYAVRMAVNRYEIMVRGYDDRYELTGLWFMKFDSTNKGVSINKIL